MKSLYKCFLWNTTVFLLILVQTYSSRADVPSHTMASGSESIAAIASPLHLAVANDIDPTDRQGATAHYDFGHANSRMVNQIEHTFTLRNENLQSLRLDRFQASCGCTSAVISASTTGLDGQNLTIASAVIVSHQVFRVRVSVDTAHLTSGPFEKYVWIYVQGQVDAVATLKITGTWSAGVRFSPDVLDFGKVTAGTTHRRKLTLIIDDQWLKPGTTFHLVASNPDLIIAPIVGHTVGEEKTTQPSDISTKTQVFLLSLSSHPRIGLVSGTISLVVSSRNGFTRTTDFSVPFQGEVKGEIETNPQVVAFGVVVAKQPAIQQVTISSKREIHLQNLKASSDNPFIFTKFVCSAGMCAKRKRAHSVKLFISLSPRIPKGTIEALITICTPDRKQIVLPVSAYVANP